MNLIDIILIALLIIFAVYGAFSGFIHAISGLIGAIVSFFMAAKLYLPLAASSYGAFLGGNTNQGKVISFAIIFLILARLVGLIVWAVDRFFQILSALPLFGFLNRLIGAFFGLLEGVLFLAGVIYVTGKYPFTEPLALALTGSKIAVSLHLVVKFIEPIIPQALKSLRSVFDAPSEMAADYIRKYFKF